MSNCGCDYVENEGESSPNNSEPSLQPSRTMMTTIIIGTTIYQQHITNNPYYNKQPSYHKENADRFTHFPLSMFRCITSRASFTCR